MVVGSLLSYWVLVTFQGQTVKLRGGNTLGCSKESLRNITSIAFFIWASLSNLGLTLFLRRDFASQPIVHVVISLLMFFFLGGDLDDVLRYLLPSQNEYLLQPIMFGYFWLSIR